MQMYMHMLLQVLWLYWGHTVSAEAKVFTCALFVNVSQVQRCFP